MYDFAFVARVGPMEKNSVGANTNHKLSLKYVGSYPVIFVHDSAVTIAKADLHASVKRNIVVRAP